MSVKACQLCGKPLSRLRVGADPEFCSKDHRNQFRLRRGMDRLVEVNKVANLMRRRETLRPVTFSSLMCQSAITPRGFYEAKPTAIHTTPFTRKTQYQALGQPRITAHAEHCLPLRTGRHAGQRAIRRPNTGNIVIRNLDTRPALPDGRWTLPAHIVQAPPRHLHHRAPAQPKQREYNLLRQRGIRVHVGRGPAALRRVPFSGTEALSRGVRKPGVRFAAVVGNALRVSIGKGFTIPAAKVRHFQSHPAMKSSLVYAGLPMTVATDVLNRDAESRSLSAATTAIAMRLPRAPRASHSSEFQARDARPPAFGSPKTGASPAARQAAIEWTPPSARWNPGGINPAAAGFSRRNGAHLKRLAVHPNRVASSPQVTFRPFIPQEPVGCPVVPFQAVIAGGAPTPPPPAMVPELSDVPKLKTVPKPAPIEVHFEEHFEGGWDNWVGGVEDWKVDVAGVRTGSMALFMPTLDLTDYVLEFFARIDNRSINWVVRAAGEDQHIRCTLTALEGNLLEFSRTFVSGGAVESSVVSATRVPGKKRSALTIRTTVLDDSFTVMVDGHKVDTWTEQRLPTGGVGFVGAADDRARLYWVKVSSSQSTGKE